eukprot:g4915.t1
MVGPASRHMAKLGQLHIAATDYAAAQGKDTEQRKFEKVFGLLSDVKELSWKYGVTRSREVTIITSTAAAPPPAPKAGGGKKKKANAEGDQGEGGSKMKKRKVAKDEPEEEVEAPPEAAAAETGELDNAQSAPQNQFRTTSEQDSEETKKLTQIAEILLPCFQNAIKAGKSSETEKASRAAKMEISTVEEFGIRPLRAVCAYFELLTIKYIADGLAVEDIHADAVISVKQIFRELVQSIRDPRQNSQAKWAPDFDEAVGDELEERGCEVLVKLHEYVERRMSAIASDLVHQLIVLGVGVFYYSHTTIRLCEASEKLMVSFFARSADYRRSMFQEIFTNLHLIPHKKTKRKEFAVKSGDAQITVWTRFFLRLLQSSCNPYGFEFDSVQVTEEDLKKQFDECNRLCMEFSASFLRTIFRTSAGASKVGRALPDESKDLLENTIVEFLNAMYLMPDTFPVAQSLVSKLLLLCGKHFTKADQAATIRDCSCRMLALMQARWWKEVKAGGDNWDDIYTLVMNSETMEEEKPVDDGLDELFAEGDGMGAAGDVGGAAGENANAAAPMEVEKEGAEKKAEEDRLGLDFEDVAGAAGAGSPDEAPPDDAAKKQAEADAKAVEELLVKDEQLMTKLEMPGFKRPSMEEDEMSGSAAAKKNMKKKKAEAEQSSTEYDLISKCCWTLFDRLLTEKPKLFQDALTEEDFSSSCLIQHQFLILRHLEECGLRGKLFVPPLDTVVETQIETTTSTSGGEDKDGEDGGGGSSSSGAEGEGAAGSKPGGLFASGTSDDNNPNDQEDDLLLQEESTGNAGGNKMKKMGKAPPMGRAASPSSPAQAAGAAGMKKVKQELLLQSASVKSPKQGGGTNSKMKGAKQEMPSPRNNASSYFAKLADSAAVGTSSSTTTKIGKHGAKRTIATTTQNSVVYFRDCVVPADHPVFARSYLIAYWACKDDSKHSALPRLFADGLSQPDSVDFNLQRTTVAQLGLIPSTMQVLMKKAIACWNQRHLVRNDSFKCLIGCAHAQQASLRRNAISGLRDVFQENLKLSTDVKVIRCLDVRLSDVSSWVRQATLDLIGNFMDEDNIDDEEMKMSDEYGKMLLQYYKSVRSRIEDVSVLVRRKACMILAVFVSTNPTHEDVADICVELLRRSADNEKIRRVTMNAFVGIWFKNAEEALVTAQMCQQLTRVVHESVQGGMEDFFKNLIDCMEVHGDERAKVVQAWATRIFENFVELSNREWGTKMPFLTTMKAFCQIQPEVYARHLKQLTLYVQLENDSSNEDQVVADHVCLLIADCLKYTTNRRDLLKLDSQLLRNNLVKMFTLKGENEVKSSVTCLSAVVERLTFDWQNDIYNHVERNMANMMKFVKMVESFQKEERDRRERAGEDGVALLLPNGSSTDGEGDANRYILKPASTEADEAGGGAVLLPQEMDTPGPKMVIRRAMRIVATYAQCVRLDQHYETKCHQKLNKKCFAKEGKLSATILDLLLTLYRYQDADISPTVLPCLADFLMTNREYVRLTAVQDVFRHALQRDPGFETRDDGVGASASGGGASAFQSAEEGDNSADMDGEQDHDLQHDPHLANGTPLANGHSTRGSTSANALPNVPPASAAKAVPSAAPSQVKCAITTGSFNPATGFRQDGLVRKGLKALFDLLMYFSDAAERETNEKYTDADKSDRKGELSAAESASPLNAHLAYVLDLLYQHPDDEVRSDAIGVVRQLSAQGLLNPMDVFPRLVGLCFEQGTIPKRATDLAKKILESRTSMITSRLPECMAYAFQALLRAEAVFGGQEAISAEHFKAITEMYVDVRKQKKTRETILKMLLDQIANIYKQEEFEKRFPRFACEENPVVGQLTDHMPEFQKLEGKGVYRILFVQFVALVLGSLPFHCENEPLFVIHHITRWTTLHADSMVSQAEAGDTISPMHLFCVTISTCALSCIKEQLKSEYNLSDERCREYEPAGGVVDRNQRPFFGDGSKENEENAGLKLKFPLATWRAIAESFSFDVDQNVQLLQSMAEKEGVGDVNMSRARELLGKIQQGGKKKGPGGRGRKKAAASTAAAGAAEAAAEASASGAAPSPDEGSADPGTNKKNKKRPTAGTSALDDDDDEDDGPAAKKKKGAMKKAKK